MIQKAKFAHSTLRKAFQKQIKSIEERGKITWSLKCLKPPGQRLTFKNAIPEDKLNEEAKNEIAKNEIAKMEKKKNSKKEDLAYETNRYV